MTFLTASSKVDTRRPIDSLGEIHQFANEIRGIAKGYTT
jgi:hypothetical protein